MRFIGNRYEILQVSDEIELNKLYKARDAYNNTKVLIKIIENNEHICNDFVANFIDEMTIINELNSPYILKILDVGIHCTEEALLYYIVSEYTDGITLDKIIQGNYIHLEAMINMSTQILRSLETASEHNLYHGDLKPENIIVDEAYNVKVCNYGVVKANRGINLRVCEDIKYLSPHQICINYTDTESDLFSLGIVLYEAIFKKTPFGEYYTEEEALKYIDKGVEWNKVTAINGNIELINIIKKLLNRTKKYENIQSVIIDLSKVMYEKADIEEDETFEPSNEVINVEKRNPKNKGYMAIAVVAIMIILILTSI